MSGSLRLIARLQDGGDDVGIGSATADVAAHIFSDVIFGFRVSLIHAAYRRQDLSRRAIAALERIMVDEGLLHRMQLAVAGGEPLDGSDILAFVHHGKG